MAKKKKSGSNALRTSQDEYFRIARKIWASVLSLIAEFAKKKGFYTEPFVTAALARLKAAEDIPGSAAINEPGKRLRDELTGLAKAAVEEWDMLAAYIKTAFPDKALRENELVAAGKAKAASARKQVWDSVSGLMLAGRQYIALHTPELEANNNMPKDYDKTFAAAADAFSAKLTAYTNAKENRGQKSSARQEAIAATYLELMNVCEDGQLFFKNEPEKQQLFIYDEVKRIVLGTKPGGVKGAAKNENGSALKGVKVTLEFTGHETVSDAKGRYELKQLAAGTYNVFFSLEGYETLMVEHEVEAGIIGRLNVSLKKVS